MSDKDRGGKPPCPHCQSELSQIVDSGSTSALLRGAYPRRRECLGCGRRWTTYEVNQRPQIPIYGGVVPP